MKRSCLILSSFCCLLLLAGETRVRASVVTDQVNLNTQGGRFTSGTAYAQTFTVGVAGNLVEIDLEMFNFFGAATDTITLDVRSILSGFGTSTVALGGTNLATVTLPTLPASGNAFVLEQFNFSGTPIAVNVNDELAFVLHASVGNSYEVGVNNSPSYFPRGSDYSGTNAGPSYGLTLGGASESLAFQTLVDTPAQVPEPGSLALLSLAAASAAGYAWRRNRRNPVKSAAQLPLPVAR